LRLALEFAVLGGGAAAVAFAARPELGIGFGLIIVAHHLVSLDRVE
jgi:hypothetical protein